MFQLEALAGPATTSPHPDTPTAHATAVVDQLAAQEMAQPQAAAAVAGLGADGLTHVISPLAEPLPKTSALTDHDERWRQILDLKHDIHNELLGIQYHLDFIQAELDEGALKTSLTHLSAIIRSRINTFTHWGDDLRHFKAGARHVHLTDLFGRMVQILILLERSLQNTATWLERYATRLERMSPSVRERTSQIKKRISDVRNMMTLQRSPVVFDVGDALDTLCVSRDIAFSSVNRPLPVFMDPVIFRRFIYNFQANATTFGNRPRDAHNYPYQTSMRITLTQESNQAVIRVSDNGNGMAASSLFRIRDALAGDLGRGQGLPFIRDEVKRAGGSISVESRTQDPYLPVDQREFVTTFTLRLPLHDATPHPPAPALAQAA